MDRARGRSRSRCCRRSRWSPRGGSTGASSGSPTGRSSAAFRICRTAGVTVGRRRRRRDRPPLDPVAFRTVPGNERTRSRGSRRGGRARLRPTARADEGPPPVGAGSGARRTRDDRARPPDLRQLGDGWIRRSLPGHAMRDGGIAGDASRRRRDPGRLVPASRPRTGRGRSDHDRRADPFGRRRRRPDGGRPRSAGVGVGPEPGPRRPARTSSGRGSASRHPRAGARRRDRGHGDRAPRGARPRVGDGDPRTARRGSRDRRGGRSCGRTEVPGSGLRCERAVARFDVRSGQARESSTRGSWATM